MTPEVAIVVSPRDWAERLHRFVADHGGARVRARVLDGREAVDERYQVLVAEDLTSFLTPRLVGELHRTGRRVLGVFDDAEPWGRQRLLELGVDEAVPADAGPEAILRSIEALAVEAVSDLDAELRALGGADDDPAPPHPDVGGSGRARVIAVTGPPGGAGRTEVAIGLASGLAAAGRGAVLVDADDVAPSVAQRLGLALHPNLRAATDVLEHWHGQLADCLQPVGGAGVEVLVGLTSGRDSSELRPSTVLDLLRELADDGREVVVDLGCRLEEVGGLVTTHSRYALHRMVVADADLVVAVGAATPVGLARLLEWVAAVRALSSAPLAIAFNRVPTGSFRRAELEDELHRSFVPHHLGFLPEDRRVRDAAWAGELLRRGPFARAVRAFADDLLPVARGAVR